MTDTLRLFFKFAGMNIRSQMQYRVPFIMLLLGNFTITFVEFLAISILFTRFGMIKGWALGDIAMCYGFISASFGIAEGIGRGFDMFALQVLNGEFDRTLLRPRSTVLQVFGHDFNVTRSGRAAQGILVVAWASIYAGIHWTAAKALLALFALAGGIAVFTGILMIQAAMCFWSTQSLEIMNSFTYGGIEAAQWPIPIYNRWFARFFIFVIPLACVNYFPVLAIIGKADPLGSPAWFHWAAPAIGFVFLGIGWMVWQYGVRHYKSTGS